MWFALAGGTQVTDQPLYTLDEARRVIRGERCLQQGHLLVMVDGNATLLRCGHCDRLFNLVPADTPTTDETTPTGSHPREGTRRGGV